MEERNKRDVKTRMEAVVVLCPFDSRKMTQKERICPTMSLGRLLLPSTTE